MNPGPDWWPLILNTLLVVLIGFAVALPLGVGTAVYLHLFAQASLLRRLLRLGLQLLAAVPSVLLGLLGFWLLVVRLNLGWSLLSGGLTLGVMLLPGLAATAEAALGAVQPRLREASLALGADLTQTLCRVDLPAALPGILAGVVLALARAVGETAVVLLTVGTAHGPDGLGLHRVFAPGRTLSVELYLLATEAGDSAATWRCAGLLTLVGVGAVLVMRLLGAGRSGNVTT